jgi:hypothetical protein
MANKKYTIFKIPKVEDMPDYIYKSRFFIALACAILLLCAGCKKTLAALGNKSALQEYFDEEILNRTFVVDLATDSTVDITNRYAGYKFILTRTSSFIDGPMIGYLDADTIRGTWTSSDDYGFLTINLNTPVTPTSFVFLNRKWRFVRKDVPIMQLAPYGTLDPKVLNMRRL